MPGRRYVIDYHTAAFTLPIHQRLFFIQRFFARRAMVNLLTNAHLGSIVSAWGGRVLLVSDVRVRYSSIKAFAGRRAGFNITFVSCYSVTEPLDRVYEAARRLEREDVHIFVTGDLKDAPPEILVGRPHNVTLTGFLRDEEYAGLLRDSDAVMCLCTKDNTMQRGAYEAMALETPLVLSNWKLLRDTFSSGAVYVDNSVEGICNGIRTVRADLASYQLGILELKRRRAAVWERTLAQLNSYIDSFAAGATR
jgi:glycosyltransferase involved in cell wall biosynthesis